MSINTLNTEREKVRVRKERQRERGFKDVIAMTWKLDVLHQRKALQDGEVFPVSPPRLITHKAVTLVFKGHGKKRVLSHVRQVCVRLLRGSMINEKLTTSWPKKSPSANR